MEFLKKNFVIFLAFTLPILFIIGVALSIYIPSFFLSTNYNFVYIYCAEIETYLYASCPAYLEKRYSVVGNKLITHDLDYSALNLDNNEMLKPREVYDIKNYDIHFFVHDTKKNEGKEITFEETQSLTLNNLSASPDGVTISDYDYYDRRRGSIFFNFFGGDSSSSYGYYLTKGNGKTKINLFNTINNKYDYQENDFHFIGWVLPGRN